MSTAPLTQISTSKGMSSVGNATLAFFLADESASDVLGAADEASVAGLEQQASQLLQQYPEGKYDYQTLLARAQQVVNARYAQILCRHRNSCCPGCQAYCRCMVLVVCKRCAMHAG